MERFAFFTCHYGIINSDVGVKRVSGGVRLLFFLTSFLKENKTTLTLNKNEMNILLKNIIIINCSH